MLKIIYRSSLATLVFAFLLCGVYPLLVTLAGSLMFPDQVNGSFVMVGSSARAGSKLIGQNFTKPEYLHGRPSAAGSGYDASSSSGSNLGPTNQKFVDTLKANVDAFMKENPKVQKGQVPTEMVTASASGLDPHISLEGSLAQVARIAQARGVSEDLVQNLMRAHVEGPTFGFLGEAVINVLLVNLDLDKQYPVKK